jgi:hypothetical protein
MSYLENAMDIALMVLIFSSVLALLNNPVVGVGDELGVNKNFETGVNQEDLEEGVASEKDMTPNQSIDYFFKAFLIGFRLLSTIIKIPFAIFNAITMIIPGAIGVAMGTLFQVPADMIMLAGLAQYFKR